jgi:cyclic lactone autoinducer peptide
MLVSEKSALGTNSVPSSGTMKMLVTKISTASASVASLWASDQRKMPW